MVEQEAVNFEVAGSSPAVGAKKNPQAFMFAVFSCFDDVDWDQQPQRKAMLGCGSITRSRAGKFTFLNATMLYLDSPAVGAKHKHYDESHGVFVF